MHEVLGFGLKSRQLVLREQITQGHRNWKFNLFFIFVGCGVGLSVVKQQGRK